MAIATLRYDRMVFRFFDSLRAVTVLVTALLLFMGIGDQREHDYPVLHYRYVHFT